MRDVIIIGLLAAIFVVQVISLAIIRLTLMRVYDRLNRLPRREVFRSHNNGQIHYAED